MKLFLQRTLQAILEAELAFSQDGVQEANGGFEGDAAVARKRNLKTILGPVTLQLPANGRVRFLPPLFRRYPTRELDFLCWLGRMLVRGCAAPGTIQDMVERLCGHPFDTSQVAAISAAIEQELSRYFQRERERGLGSATPWRNVNPRSGLPRVHFMQTLFRGSVK